MDQPEGSDPIQPPTGDRSRRRRRDLVVGLALAAAYALVYLWLDNYQVPDVIAASNPWDAPETQWRVAQDALPEGAAGLYYVPGIGILPVARDARWTDGDGLGAEGTGRLMTIYDDRLNTWGRHADLIELPLLPPFVHVSQTRLDPGTQVDGVAGEGRAIAVRDPEGRWQYMLEHGVGKSRPPSLPSGGDHLLAHFFRADPPGVDVTLPIRSPERGNAARAERIVLPSARDAVTIAVAAVAAWPGGTAIRLEGWTDDPHDVVLLGLDIVPGSHASGDDHLRNDTMAADPKGAVVLRDDQGRMYPVRNAERLGERRGSFRWAEWLGHGNAGIKPGIDLPATLLFDALPADAKALTLAVGSIRVAHDLLLPEDADRPAEGESRETLTIPVPVDAPAVARGGSHDFDAPLDDLPVMLAGARVVARRVQYTPDGVTRIDLVNESPSAARRLVDVFGIPEQGRTSDGQRFAAHFVSVIRYDAGPTESVRVFVRDGPRWPVERATAIATVWTLARPGEVPWPPRGARPFTVAFVRPIVEVSGRWTFALPMDALRANAAANAGVVASPVR
ncbi:MAG: hypothetical protein ABI780_10595 [Ardenticatenales bacterium]